MKSAEQIEQSIRKLALEAGAQGRERTLRDLVGAHTRQKEKTPASRRWSLRRTIMTHGTRKVAAVVALALLLIGALSLGTGSVAFSQAGHAVNSTLSWLKGMIVGPRVVGEPPAPAGLSRTGDETANPDRKVITYAAGFFTVPENESGLWQSLRDQGIEFVKASTDPEVYYATLRREQGESFDACVTLRRVSSPRVTVSEGETAAIAMTDSHPSRGMLGLALGLLPTVSSDGKEVQSTISFHDGRHGFEIPNASTESGGVVLIRA